MAWLSDRLLIRGRLLSSQPQLPRGFEAQGAAAPALGHFVRHADPGQPAPGIGAPERGEQLAPITNPPPGLEAFKAGN
jgi:hypothetical protein